MTSCHCDCSTCARGRVEATGRTHRRPARSTEYYLNSIENLLGVIIATLFAIAWRVWR